MGSDVAEAAALFRGVSLVQLVALVALLGLRRSAAARVGAVRHRVQGGQRRRRLAGLGLGLLALLAVLVPGTPVAPALALLGISAVLVALTPAENDTAVGAEGAQAGWRAARFADFAEWRLTGEHLRWRQSGEWLASHAPSEHHAELRAALERAAPERESRFKS